MSKRPTWYLLRRLLCVVFGHPWANEYGTLPRGRGETGAFCERCWREF